MTRKLTFIVVLFVSSVVLASTVVAQAIISGDEIKKIVTFIFPSDDQGNLRRDPKNNPIPYGTGFFVAVNNDTGKGSGESAFVYLVTAKHVLKDENGADFDRVYLRLNTLKGEAAFIPLDLVQNGQRLVFTHPDPTVDIAVAPAVPSQTLFDFKAVPEDLLSTKETFTQYNIAEGSDVVWQCFQTNLFHG
jgi:hypothetical protein